MPLHGATGRSDRGTIKHDTKALVQVRKDGLTHSLNTFKRGLEIFSRALSNKNTALVFRGTDCYTTGKTIVVPEIDLLSRPNMTETEVEEAADLLETIRGRVVHEVGHVLYTDFAACEDAVRREKGALVKQIWNALEDAFVERRMVEDYGGTGVILDNMNEWHSRAIMTEIEKGVVSPIAQVVLGTTIVAKYGTDHWFYRGLSPSVRAILDKLGAEINRTRTVSNSWEVLALATDLLDKIEKLASPPPPPPPPKKGKGKKDKGKQDKKDEGGEDSEAGDEGEATDDGDDDEDEDAGGGAGGAGEDDPVESDPEDAGDDGDDPDDEGGDADSDDEDDSASDDGGAGEEDGGDDPDDDGDSGSSRGGTDDDADGDDGEEADADAKRGLSGSDDEDDDTDDSSLGAASGEGDDFSDDTLEDDDTREELKRALDDSDKAAKDLEEADSGSTIQRAMSGYVGTGLPSDRYLIYTTEYDQTVTPPITDAGRAAYTRLSRSLRDPVAVGKRQLANLLKARSLSHVARDLEEGELDRSRLYRLATRGDARIFKETVDRSSLKGVAAILMINLSGSMSLDAGVGQSRIDLAIESALIFGECLSGIGVPFEVLGHSTTVEEGAVSWNACAPALRSLYTRWGGTIIEEYKRFDEDWRKVAPRVTGATLRWNTHDAEAVKLAANRLLARPDATRRIVLMLDDGEPFPNVWRTGIFHLTSDPDFPAKMNVMRKHTAALPAAVKEVEAAGVEVIGFGMGSNSVQSYYKDHLVVTNTAEFSKLFVEKLKKILLAKKR